MLTQPELRKLRRVTGQGKDEAMKTGKRTAVVDWFLICLGLETGLRVQEMTDLKYKDFHTAEGRKSIRVRRGKGGKPRTVYIREAFVENIKEFLSWKNEHGESVEPEASVFSIAGRKMSKRALQKSYDRSKEKAGIKQPDKIGIHSLRHTYATYLLAATGNLRFVQRQLGHASIKTTEIYSHILDAMKLVEKLYA